MNELWNIIIEHAKKYPLMKPQDAALLIYENEYGPGKYKENDEALANRFKIMYAAAAENKNDYVNFSEITENIGGGYVRIYLSHVGLSYYEQLKQAYIASVRESSGTHYYLTPKLCKLIDVKADGEFNFTMQALEEYLMEYEESDYPQPEHSSEYTKAYAHAYCVISNKYLDKLSFLSD